MSQDLSRARAQGQAPRLRRRLAAFIYEGVLLFGPVMAVGGLYAVGTQQRHGLTGREGMMASQFLMLGLYFVWFWSHGGQTLAMKTWHLRLVSEDGGPVLPKQALGRYLASWLWFLPPWAGAWLAGWHTSGLVFGLMGVWFLIYISLTRLLPRGQFLHDSMCRTCVIDTRVHGNDTSFKQRT